MIELNPTKVLDRIDGAHVVPTAEFNDHFNECGRPAWRLGALVGAAVRDLGGTQDELDARDMSSMLAFMEKVEPPFNDLELRDFQIASHKQAFSIGDNR